MLYVEAQYIKTVAFCVENCVYKKKMLKEQSSRKIVCSVFSKYFGYLKTNFTQFERSIPFRS